MAGGGERDAVVDRQGLCGLVGTKVNDPAGCLLSLRRMRHSGPWSKPMRRGKTVNRRTTHAGMS